VELMKSCFDGWFLACDGRIFGGFSLSVIEIPIASLEVVVVIVSLELATKLKLFPKQLLLLLAVVQKNYFVRPTAADVCCFSGLAKMLLLQVLRVILQACMVTLAAAATSKGHYFVAH